VRALDWLGRVSLLVLSGTATLSLIGAIAEVAHIGEAPAPSSSTQAVMVEPMPLPPGATVERTRVEPGVAAPMPDREAVRWLQALTYAVTALAGFAAAGVIVLLRMTATLERIARR
jgi:hypothetical protein